MSVKHLNRKAILATLKKSALPSPRVIDTMLGIRREGTEKALDLGGLLLKYGAHRLDAGDHSYSTIVSIFQKIPASQIESLHDLGSGYGRVVLVAGLLGVRSSGIELISERVEASIAARNFLSLNNVLFYQGNAVSAKTPMCSHYCLLNSFSHSILPRIIQKLYAISQRRKITIISKSGSNVFLAKQFWLEEILNEVNDPLGIRIFQSTKDNER